MTKRITNKTIANNIKTSVFVQGISLLVSFILSVIVPAFISELQYSYWQTYLLYVNYVGVLHFGLLDGLMLRYSHYDYEELDKKVISSQFNILFFIVSMFSVIGIYIALWKLEAPTKYIVLFVAIGMVTKNIFTYNSYLFQMTNRIGKYALLIVFQKGVYGCLIVVFLLLDIEWYGWYCIADLLGDIISCLFLRKSNKELYLSKLINVKEAISEYKKNISVGMLLLFSNWFSLLILGSAKMFIQWKWGSLLFGKISFSLSISNLFIAFISAVSIVLFPMLKRMENDKLPSLYFYIRKGLTSFLLIAMLFYFPCRNILNYFLPAYKEGVEYLGVLLPVVAFTSKITLLTNTYLKTYRKEREMLKVNFCAVVLALLLFGVSAYCVESLQMLLLSIVVVTMISSVLSELVVMKTIKIFKVKDFGIELVICCIFIISTQCIGGYKGMLLYSVAICVYCLYYKKDLYDLIRNVVKNKVAS